MVVIGGSYKSSGDLRRTPIDDFGAPGAMIHINAIRAFGMALKSDTSAPWLVFGPEKKYFHWISIFVAASISALFYGVGLRLARDTSTLQKAVVGVSLSAACCVAQFAGICAIVLFPGAEPIIASSSLEISATILAVMLEGLSDTLHAIHELFRETIEAFFGAGVRLVQSVPKHSGTPAGTARLEVSQYLSRTVVIDDGQDEAAPKPERK